MTKCILGLFTILSTVKNDAMHTPLPNTATNYQRLVHRFHEANELFDGTLNVLHNKILATYISNNEVYTYAQAIKQDDAEEFVKAMEVEVEAHKQRNHWTMVLRSTLPTRAKTIRAIGHSNARDIQMGDSTNIRQDCVHMEGCNNGETTIGKRIHRLLTC